MSMADYGARVRAARAYADLTQEQLAERLGVNVQTIKRREMHPGDELYQPPKRGERLAIAVICGVPPAFMEDGFGGYGPDELVDTVTQLAGQVEQIQTLLLQQAVDGVAEQARSGGG